MALEFQNVHVNFGSLKGSPQTVTKRIQLTRPINVAELALRSYTVGYTSADHHLYQLEILLGPPGYIRGEKSLDITVTYLLRDYSGVIDDKFEGKIEVLAIADVAA